MFTQIVVGWDGTDAAEAALRWALRRADGTPLRLVHAIGGAPTSDEVGRAGGELSAERVRLIDRADQLRAEHPALEITTSTVHGTPVEALGAELRAGVLAVVGAAGSHRGSRWSVGSRLAGREGGGAVVVVPSVVTEGGSVVVGVDGSPAAYAAIEVAASEAARLGAELELVHSWMIPVSWDTGYVEYFADTSELEEMHQDVLDEAMQFAQSLEAAPVGRLERGPAPVALERAADGAALLVLGSHGRGRLARFLLGSVSHELLVALPAPTMVVGPAER